MSFRRQRAKQNLHRFRRSESHSQVRNNMTDSRQCLFLKAQPPPPMCVVEASNYPNVTDVFGITGLGKMYASHLEFMWRNQDRQQDSDRSIMLDDCPIGVLEFSVTRDLTKSRLASHLAVNQATRY